MNTQRKSLDASWTDCDISIREGAGTVCLLFFGGTKFTRETHILVMTMESDRKEMVMNGKEEI